MQISDIKKVKRRYMRASESRDISMSMSENSQLSIMSPSYANEEHMERHELSPSASGNTLSKLVMTNINGSQEVGEDCLSSPSNAFSEMIIQMNTNI